MSFFSIDLTVVLLSSSTTRLSAAVDRDMVANPLKLHVKQQCDM